MAARGRGGLRHAAAGFRRASAVLDAGRLGGRLDDLPFDVRLDLGHHIHRFDDQRTLPFEPGADVAKASASETAPDRRSRRWGT